MNLLKKSIFVVALLATSSFSFATYVAKIPLEVSQGGRLPDNSIVIDDKTSEKPSSESNSNCEYNYDAVNDTGTFVSVTTDNDVYYFYNSNFIGYLTQDESNIPSGVSIGKKMYTDVYGDLYEICGDNLSNHPTVPPPGIPGGGLPSDPNEQACLNKRSQADSIAASYNTIVTDLYYISGNCMADVRYPSGGWDAIVNDFNAIGIRIAM